MITSKLDKVTNFADDPLFPLGKLAITPGAQKAMEKNAANPIPYLTRHQSGDWGDVGEEDAEVNKASLKYGNRIMSVYYLYDETKIWVITEADRYCTTIILPEEY